MASHASYTLDLAFGSGENDFDLQVEDAARGDAVFHGEWLAKTSGHSGGFAAEQRQAGIHIFAFFFPI